MSNAFSEIAFTPSVRAAQERYGSRAAMRRFADAAPSHNELSARESDFIAERDSFFQATVSETGWPYVQHRGGPPGFLRALDSRTIGYADFRGNVQYVSAGNIAANDRVALILVDYASRTRLKIWGHARIVQRDGDAGAAGSTGNGTPAGGVAAADSALMDRLAVPAYGARVERGIVIRVEAFAWNCPQHIPRQYDAAEMQRLIAPLLEENCLLKAQHAAQLAQLQESGARLEI